jgi:cyclic pyranopterin phosphate synthase
MTDLTHVGPAGEARMVDVTDKQITQRFARARGAIRMRKETLAAIRSNSLQKGDVIAVARVAGIMAAKRTSELIPLCHPIALTEVAIDLEPDESIPGIRVEAIAKTAAQTGVEMEAITGVAVSLITIYDMAKGIDTALEIGEICLVEKAGGRRGHFKRD